MGRRISILLFTTLLLGVFTTDAFARNGRQTQIPNNRWDCQVCHTQAGGLNDFGFDSFDYTSGGSVNWAGLSQEDSDRDGYSNGLELADPNGTGGNNGATITHPGDRNDGPCGNGTLDGPEECEAGNLGGATCASLGLVSGTLGCNQCRFDTSSCDSCGDGVLQGGEECDAADLGGNTCESLGRGTGTLSCNGCSYDFSGCADTTTAPPQTCGNGTRQTDEACDGSDLGGQTCATQGYTGGILSCTVRCELDTTACIGGAGVGPGADAPGPASQTGPTSGDLSVQDDPSQKIELGGYACATAVDAPAPSAGALVLLLLGVVVRRRSGSIR